MDELETMDAAAEDEMEPQADGSTFILGPEGWETADFIDPEDDWRLLADGSYLSAGRGHPSWPLAGPEPL